MASVTYTPIKDELLLLRKITNDWTTIEKPMRTPLKKLLASGYINVRTVTIRNWGSSEDIKNWLIANGLKGYPGRSNPALAQEYRDLWYDRVIVEAKLTPQGLDVLIATT